MEEIKILKMERKHLDEVSLLHIEAFKDYPSTKLGKLYVKAFLKLFLESKFSICFVAVDGIKICGYVVGIESDKLKTKKIASIIFLSFLMKSYLFFERKVLKKIYRRLRSLFKMDLQDLPNLPHPFISLVGIAVDPEKNKEALELYFWKALRKKQTKGDIKPCAFQFIMITFQQEDFMKKKDGNLFLCLLIIYIIIKS